MSESSERGGSLRGIVACAAAVMLFAAIYVGSYLALLNPIATYEGERFVGRVAQFRFGEGMAEIVFWPLTQLDMLVRPDYWRPRATHSCSRSSL